MCIVEVEVNMATALEVLGACAHWERAVVESRVQKVRPLLACHVGQTEEGKIAAKSVQSLFLPINISKFVFYSVIH